MTSEAYFRYPLRKIWEPGLNKLAEWLKRIGRGEGPRMGFGATVARAKGPKMGLLATLPSLEKDLVGRALEAGAQALILPSGLAADGEVLSSVIQSFSQCLWGLQLDDSQFPKPAPEFDFFVLSLSSALSSLKAEEPGRLLAIDQSCGDVQLRALDQLPLDGVVFPLAMPGENLRVEHLLTVRRLSLLLRKPLIAELGRSLGEEDLRLLRDAGLVGLLVRGDTIQWAETIKELSQAIEGLPVKGRERREVDVVLPFMPGGRAPQTGEEEEEP